LKEAAKLTLNFSDEEMDGLIAQGEFAEVFCRGQD